MKDYTELLKRLGATRSTSTFPQYEPDAPQVLINPDGREAAAAIRELQAKYEASTNDFIRMRETKNRVESLVDHAVQSNKAAVSLMKTEYARGLEDAAKKADKQAQVYKSNHRDFLPKSTKAEFKFATVACEYVANEIRALKPKELT